MTLNEAINHLKETLNDPNHEWSCESCKNEHEQLLSWLLELKTYKECDEKDIDIIPTETFIEHDIKIGDNIIGSVELCPERHEISRLNIWEPYQNKGFGTFIVSQLVHQGYTNLWVRSDNPRAIHVYEKCGFSKGDTHMFEMSINK